MNRQPLSQKELDDLIVDTHLREGAGQIFDELRQALCILNLVDVQSMIEIGVENGGSLSIWQKLWDPLQIIAVDLDSYGINASRADREARWKSWFNPSQKLDVVWGNSHADSTLSRVKELTAGVYHDLLFIDGDHSEKGVEMDYEMYKQFVRPGGLILFSDIHEAPNRPDMKADVFWNKIKPVPIPQSETRAPNIRKNWQAFDLFHNKGHQSAFGWGFIFV